MKNIALFIDHENIRITLKNEYSERVDLEKILNIIRYKLDEFRIVVGKSYLETDRRSTSYNYEFYIRGIEPVYSPTFQYNGIRKSLSDPMMISDMLEVLYTKQFVDSFILVTNDKDFIPIIRKIIGNGKNVLVIGTGNAEALIKECTRLNIPFVAYEDFESTNDTGSSY